MRNIRERVHPLTLQINDPQLEKDYGAASIIHNTNYYRLAYCMGIIMNIVYVIADLRVLGVASTPYVQVELFIVIPIMLLALGCSYTSIYKKIARTVNLLVVLLIGTSIIFLSYIDQGVGVGPYLYVSLILVIIFLYAFYRMPYLSALVIGTLLVIGYIVVQVVYVQPSSNDLLYRIINLVFVNILGVSIAYIIEYQSKTEFLLNKNLADSVVKDALTELHNRHYFDQFLVPDIKEFIHRSQSVMNVERRQGDIKTAKYGLFMLDIDYFKKINDTYGHHSGDLVLQQFASILQDNLRSSDDVLRVGGEEFLLVLKLTSDKYLLNFMKKVGGLIAKHKFVVEDNQSINCTVSMGLVVIPNSRTDDVHELVRYADRALYRSKDRGRNRGHYAQEYLGEITYKEILWMD